jgi:transcriptional regulator with XRE-family HTH domain
MSLSSILNNKGGKVLYRIKEVRLARGLTQTELAKRAGITRATLWRIESGRDVITTSDTLAKLCTALDTTIEHIFLQE